MKNLMLRLTVVLFAFCLASPAMAYTTNTAGTTQQTNVTCLTLFNGTAKLPSYTVATLPSCSVSGAGAMAYVTDANTPSWNATVAGGGSSKVPVVCDGTNWTVH